MDSKVQHSNGLKIIFCPRYFKVAIEDKDVKTKGTHIQCTTKAHVAVPIYSPAIAHLQMAKSTIPLHSNDLLMIILFEKTSKAGNKDQEQHTKTDLEEAFK